MFSRWPRYFSHVPAAEMWSVVHLPLAFISTGRSIVVVAVPRRERLEQLQALGVGADDDLDRRRRRPGERGSRDSPGSKPWLGQVLADGRVERTCSPSVAIASVSGSKSSVPASA